MIHRWILLGGALSFFAAAPANAGPCQSRGTAVFFGNGMFNTLHDADANRRALESLLKQVTLKAPGKELRTKLSYKRSEPILEQLANVVHQKGIDDFENFWVWVSSLEPAPRWFSEALQTLSANARQEKTPSFSGLQEHLEAYAKAVREGYQVILVSHSQGNFYANHALRTLPAYVDASLTGSILDKGELNPLYPKFSEVFANLQVATPVAQTVAGAPPSGDLLGHDFMKAYLKNAESRRRLLTLFTDAAEKMRYPIAYFQPAVVIERAIPEDDEESESLFFRFLDPSGKEAESVDESRGESGVLVQQTILDCFKLRAGEYQIVAETIVDHHATHAFTFPIWKEGGEDRAKEKPVQMTLSARRGIQRWKVGSVRVRGGATQEPLQVEVEIDPKPQARD